MQTEDEKGYGPIMVCLDTSASMQGEAEAMAKALTLEAMRLVHAEHRACYVYLFSGPEQILEHSLDFNQGGLTELLNFLTQTFHGGTDVVLPLLHAMENRPCRIGEKPIFCCLLMDVFHCPVQIKHALTSVDKTHS